jgi:hypothetical protein
MFEATAPTVSTNGAAKIGVIIGVKFASRVEPQFIQRSRKIAQATGFFVSAFRPGIYDFRTSRTSRQTWGNGTPS